MPQPENIASDMSASRTAWARSGGSARAHSRWPWLEASASLGRPSAPKPME